MSVNIVFDTAGFLAGLENLYEKVYTTQEVIREVKDFKSASLLELAISSNKVIIFEPTRQSLLTVTKTLNKINDISLSRTDISVAALALDLKPSLVVTDDLSLQNLLLHMNIKYYSVKLNIKISKKKNYIYKCEGCGKTYMKNIKICEICGHKVIKVSQ
ncbi:DNA-binding protein [Sulfolobus acidocaldarius]|uniref:Conserved Archaeal protein n=4 Tax=Sulfolobus acidocaldarius TaxID=2285 RepID=Q4JCM3_SULAC|nr:NOB1 family endonuclease [Sulfolobus acidocaldarius]AAY79456.1 conserved Archaeal protein [Sulfolobus acidocaldarius DSM 639]AGE70006.1 hypothetical protein SacN8_00125 [Sulfolobus acidocaldarius N8]AGE72281.1 hypothetical protein SacRon12I_00125 [Sulfolobus acidocaldarius Ron12/I]ALU29564.1 DNA-binding protein [Sulfolobus acidocaldarius]ALU32294.1 DNA-binding protein [Sulfolobus acidocaldarius]